MKVLSSRDDLIIGWIWALIDAVGSMFFHTSNESTLIVLAIAIAYWKSSEIKAILER